MSSPKNHILDALSEVHELVDGFPSSVEHLLQQYDDGASHSKREAGTIVRGHLDSLVDQLNELKVELSRKYR